MSNSRTRSRGFRKIKTQLRRMKRRIELRLDRQSHWDRDSRSIPDDRPVFSAANIQYEVADRIHGLDCGGIGAMHLLARKVGLIDAIDRQLCLLKLHLPYHESDHVLNIAYNILCGGTCLEDLELRRNNEVYLDALGAVRIPDPTTAGDFCRRFTPVHVELLQDIINEVRLNVWAQQPAEFFDEAVIDVDGTLTETFGECKEGMGLSYKKTWGYGPLVVSLANTQEVLYLKNRGGNRPSHEGAPRYLDRASALCRCAGFRKITFRGDTDFSQTAYLDGWDAQGIGFVFGMDSMDNLRRIADDLPASDWKPLKRPAKYKVKTKRRQRPENVKERIVEEAGYDNIKLVGEDVAEFEYQPGKCKRSYRMVVVRKNLSVKKGEAALFDDVRYFFYITNDRRRSASAVVFFANERCNQENLIEQLKNGVRAMEMPTGDLTSNAAYMVMATLGWTLKAWFALLLPEEMEVAGGATETAGAATKSAGASAATKSAGASAAIKSAGARTHADDGAVACLAKRTVLMMEFKTFVNHFMRIPCQVIRGGRRLVYRLLGWNRWLETFVRGLEALSGPRLC